MKSSQYADYILYDVLGHISGMSMRRMFSGWGVYKDGVILGIIVGNIFYIKRYSGAVMSDGLQNGELFSYKRADGRLVTLPYISVPEECLNDPLRIEAILDAAFRFSVQSKKEVH